MTLIGSTGHATINPWIDADVSKQGTLKPDQRWFQKQSAQENETKQNKTHKTQKYKNNQDVRFKNTD